MGAGEHLGEDRTLSPCTGWTRGHWIEVVERLVAGILPYVEPTTGIVRLPDDTAETGLAGHLRNPGGVAEMFDRTHLLVAVYCAATGRTRLPGSREDIADLYRRGMETFSDPASAFFDWKKAVAATCLAVLLAPEEFLDALEPAVRRHLGSHLSRFIHRPTRDCNTLLFSMMPAPVMDRLGVPYDRKLLDDYFEKVLAMYRGDGWFIDGWNAGFDHYNFWGFQLYLHALMAYDERWRQRYAERVRDITRLHEKTLPFFFGRDGAPIAKGRSLNYRFAVNAGISYAQISGLSSMPAGRARRIASGCLKYFVEHGCISPRGLLEPGYWGPNCAVGEDYTDRGAPYWASTGLVALALPPSHPFWTEEEMPLETERPGVRVHPVPAAQMLLKADGDRGEARLICAGEPFLHSKVWQAGSKYYQHGYSSSLGFALTGEGGGELAAGRTGISDDGVRWELRTRPSGSVLDDRRMRSEWVCDLPGTQPCAVTTETVVLDEGELHCFSHSGPAPRYLTIAGWAVQVDHNETPRVKRESRKIYIQSQSMWSVLKVLTPGVGGILSAEEVRPRPGFLHSHLFGGWAVYPRWTSKHPVQPYVKVAVFVDAGRTNGARSRTEAKVLSGDQCSPQEGREKGNRCSEGVP